MGSRTAITGFRSGSATRYSAYGFAYGPGLPGYSTEEIGKQNEEATSPAKSTA